MRGGGSGAPIILGVEGGGAPEGGARAREAAVAAPASWPGEEEERAGAGRLGRLEAEAQWRLVAAAQK
jgi:hypothetical protein